MIEHENIDLWFPTSIYRIENLVGQKELNKYEKFILNFEEKKIPTKDMFVSDIRNSSGVLDILNHKIFKKLKNQIENHTTKFASILKSNHKYKSVGSWYNVYYKNNYQELHKHSDSVFSAVYFISNPPGSGKTIFFSPIESDISLRNQNEFNDLNYSTCHYFCKPDTLIIFKSSLKHMVEQCKNEKPRITIASNLS